MPKIALLLVSLSLSAERGELAGVLAGPLGDPKTRGLPFPFAAGMDYSARLPMVTSATRVAQEPAVAAFLGRY